MPHRFARAFRASLPVVALFSGLLAGRLNADDGVLTLVNAGGATLTFVAGDDGWRWTALKTPGADAPLPVADAGLELATADRAGTLLPAWSLVENSPDKLVFEQENADLGLRVRRAFSFGSAPNAVRLETWVQSTDGRKLLARIALLEARIEGESFHEMGAGPASFPLFGQGLFAGIEHVSGEASAAGELSDRVRLLQRPRLALDETWQPVATTVVGWPLPDGSRLPADARLREAFLRYLDTVRVKPERIVLHTDTWWTVPLPLNEKNVLNDIDTLRRVFGERTGMFFDTYCVDLGWSDPKSFWRMDTSRFPNELRPINERLAGAGARMGLWASPGSGYPDGLNNSWLQSQGYELMPFPGKLGQAACMALGGRYQREFKERLVAYARQYDLGHVILDFMPQRCDVAAHGHPVGPESRYAIDAGLADVIDALRAVNPQIALEPMVCGYPPSPWWLMKTPFVLGPAGDDLPYGRGPCPEWLESLITARDVAYRSGQEAWLMPTQALETFDIVVLTPGEFQNMAVMAIGRGRWFLSTYFKSELMRPEDWDFLAALVRWARQNKQYLVNAWQFGGQPEKREAYGFMFRNPAKDLYCVRNPWIEERTIELPASATATEPRDVRMIYPRRATLGRLEPGGPGLRIAVGAYETVFLESVPAGEAAPILAPSVAPELAVSANPPRRLALRGQSANEGTGLRFFWDGAWIVPDNAEGELCILVEGPPEVAGAACKLTIDGREVKLRKTTSAGQFGAAIDASPENWTWFLAPLPKGSAAFQIEVSTAVDQTSVGVYARGTMPAGSDAAPEGAAVFPTWRAESRTWSQTLQPLTELNENPGPGS